MSTAETESNEFVDFWNQVLVPKFIKYKHMLVGGLSHHSEAILPDLPVGRGDCVLDVGCGFGDTAVYFAERVGPGGRVVGWSAWIAAMPSWITASRKRRRRAWKTSPSSMATSSPTPRAGV